MTLFKKKNGRRRNRLQFESLERRDLLAFYLADDQLTFVGTQGADYAAVYAGTDFFTGLGVLHVRSNGQSASFPASSVASIAFSGYGGDDSFLNHTAIPSCAHGGAGNDRLMGGEGVDQFYGGMGSDTLHGFAGNDWLFGEAGDDHLYGGSGSDWLYGGADDDTLVSIDNSFSDHLYGQGGYDRFWEDDLWGLLYDQDDALPSEIATSRHRVNSFENGADRTLDGDAIDDPIPIDPNAPQVLGSYANQYHGYRPLFASAGPTADDIDQGAVGDCWLMAAMGSTAHRNPEAIHNSIVYLGDGTYGVALRDDGDVPHYYRVDADLWTYTSGPSAGLPVHAGLGMEGSLWPAIIEKAYVHHRDPADRYDYLWNQPGVGAGWPDEAFVALNAFETGRTSFDVYPNGQAIIAAIAQHDALGRAVSLSMWSHAFTVIEINSPTSVRVRNPYGPAGSTQTYLDISAGEISFYLMQQKSGWISWGEFTDTFAPPSLVWPTYSVKPIVFEPPQLQQDPQQAGRTLQNRYVRQPEATERDRSAFQERAFQVVVPASQRIHLNNLLPIADLEGTAMAGLDRYLD